MPQGRLPVHPPLSPAGSGWPRRACDRPEGPRPRVAPRPGTGSPGARHPVQTTEQRQALQEADRPGRGEQRNGACDGPDRGNALNPRRCMGDRQSKVCESSDFQQVRTRGVGSILEPRRETAMICRTLLVIVVLAACGPAAAAMAPSLPFRFTEPSGPYAVGLRVVDQVDASRPFGKLRARTLQTLIWYPAQANKQRLMTVGDYVNLTRDREPEDFKKWMSRVSGSLGEPLRAARDATPSRGRFPVVIYAASDSAVSWENADLCEYLASRGYVVIASPSKGVATRDMTDDIPGTEAQARDISFLIDYAKTLPDADVSQIAVAGFSWGGLANLFAAARDDRIDALIALDGSMRYFPGLVRNAGYVHPDKMTIPLLFFTEGELTLEKIASGLSAPENIGP